MRATEPFTPDARCASWADKDLAKDYGFDEGVLLVTYSCLVARSGHNTRYEQLKRWLVGPADRDDDYEGVLAFDEAHKAKGAARDQPVGKAVAARNS